MLRLLLNARFEQPAPERACPRAQQRDISNVLRNSTPQLRPRTGTLRSLTCGFALLLNCFTAFADETHWPEALAAMPLGTNISVLNQTNCAEVLLARFQSNAAVKALIFMPGATDELYFFRRVHVALTNASPTMLDAVTALKNQSPLHITNRGAFLLIYSCEDVLDLDIKIQHEKTAEKLKTGKPLPHLLMLDRDWTQFLAVTQKKISPTLWPFPRTKESWHFYRHTFAAWNLTPWETLQAAAYSGKTKFTVVRGQVNFKPDERVNQLPKLDRFPGR